MRQYYTYIMSNKKNTVVYTGITNNLQRRIHEHKIKYNKGFTQKYNCNKLVYYETFTYVLDAIAREKQIKAGSRKKKNSLIQEINPHWQDLAKDWDKT